ncbi:MAG: hypothetical protein CFH15_00002 [Alphaproteobacteria bacterium MarineAlpha5_Bin5]|nr:MAG: hypothetical protein CFH15_00002 [Alphaproteobacteria bacterium MarineAlpha5_Bin5]
MQIIGIIRIFIKQLCFILFISCVFISHYVHATDYTISNGTTQTSRVTLTNNDTLTVDSGGEIDYTWPAVDADNRTFPEGSTTITNNGTIEGSCCVIDIRSSTNPTLINNGTINGKTSSRTIYANNSVNATITNNGDITILEANDYEAIDGDDSTGMTITNNSGATISSEGDDGIAIEGAEDVTIINAGTISAEDDWGIQADGADGLTITNSGTISAGDIYAIYLRNADDITITNSGTITAARDPINMQSSTGTVTITNSGTISQTGGGYNDGLTLQDNATITNTGTISASRYGIGGSASGVTFVNKGTINGGTYDFYVPSITITTLTNDQGGNDGLNYRGKLPTNYKIMVNSTSDYGKLLSDHTSYLTGTTTLSIDTASTLAENTYTGVFTNFTSARIAAGTTGTVTASNGVFDWTFSDANSDNTWDLVIVNGDTTAPTLSSSTPADNATGIAVNANIVLNFSEAVDAESGNITIKKTSDDSTIETIDVTGAKVSGSGGTQITINPGTNWDEKTEYYVLIDATAFDDGNSNSYAGISSTTALSFTTVDSTNPTLSSSSPADNATGVATNSNIVLTFDEAVDAESGNITIKKTSDDSTIETIDVTGAKVSGSGGTQITINPGTDWSEQTEYYVLIDATAFDDASSNSYAGISSATALSFTTGDETNPTLSSSSPTDNASDVKIGTNIVLTFSEAVDAESGNITIKKTKDDSTVAIIDVTGQYVTGSGGTEITINPAKDLDNDTEYYILIDATSFDDSTGNSYAGISNTTTLSFTTKKGNVFTERIKTIIKNQVSNSVQVITHSLNSTSSRMNYIRPRSTNISSQGIEIAMDFQNQYTNEVMQTLYPNILEGSGNLFENWAIWTEGNIAYGRVGETNDNLGQNIHSDGITIGVDKKFKNNKLLGIAFNRVWQATEVGNNVASIDTDSLTFISYGSFNINERKFLDTVLGYGEMNIDLLRKVTAGENAGKKNTGNRKGRQIFGSIKYLLEPYEISSSKNINYYSRLDLGYTALDDYSESGNSSTAVYYNKQHISNGSLSIGFNISGETKINKTIVNPFMQFEFGGDVTNNSLSEAYYLTDSSNIYTHAISDQGKKHTQLTLGFEAKLKNNKKINLTYDRYDASENMFMNTLSINFRKTF